MPNKELTIPIYAAPAGAAARDGAGIPQRLTLLLAAACGLVAANIYYAQPLVGPIGSELGLSPGAAGLIGTMTQVGYGVGLLLVVPLGDLVENRRLVLCILAVAVLALVGAALSTRPLPFLAASLFVGLGSVAVQVLVPFAAHLAPDAARGRAVGNVMGGLMLGIMLARPVASLVADASSWHVMFAASAVAIVALAIVLRAAMPTRRPAPGLGYGALLATMGRIALDTPVLRRRALYHAFLFAAFSLFWTAVPLLLSHAYHLSQRGIALFAFAGVAGVLVAPLAGRAADRGWTKSATALAMLAVIGSFLLALPGTTGSHAGLVGLVAAAVLLDIGVTANGVLGQRAIYALAAAARGRLNGLYMAAFFAAGAAGSALAGWTYAIGGWPLAAGSGLLLAGSALASFSTEPKEER